MDNDKAGPFLAEMIGTFALVFVGAGAVCAAQIPLAPNNPQPGLAGIVPGLAGIALAQGLIYAVFLSATLPISGGCLNPAVTLTLWVFKRLDTARMIWFLAAQFLGAALAGGLLRVLFNDEVLSLARFGTPHMTRAFGDANAWGAWASGIGVEVALTFLLTFIIFSTIVDPRAPRLGGLAAGLALTALVLLGFHLTGAAVNPARWFGTVLWEPTVYTLRPDAFTDNLVYLIGPILGSLLAGGLYTLLLLPGAEGTTPAASPTGGVRAAAGSTHGKAKK